ncbi:hypothetical protein RUND412_009094 [Rhizina undulata]
MAAADEESEVQRIPTQNGWTFDEEKDVNELEQIPGMPASIEDVPPDGGYGWVCVACILWVNACTWGINSSYGVFLAHYLDDNSYPGATALQYAFIGGLSLSSATIIGPLVTYLLRKTSTKTVMSIGIVLETGSLVAASFSKEIWHLFLAQGVLFGMGMGFLFTGSVGIISQWFTKRRSVANGITSAGSGIGGLIFSLVIGKIIQTMGVSWAFRIVAICAFVVNSICTALIQDRNQHVQPNQRAFDLQLLRRYEFWLVIAWGFFSMLGYIIILFSLPDFATSTGFTKTQGSILSALLSLGMAVGRPLVGLSSDRAGRINISMSMTFVTGISCFALWMTVRTFAGAVAFSLINGAVCGTFWTTISPVTVEVVGIKDLPSALSLVWLSIVLPTTFSEPIGLYLRRPGTPNPYMYPQIFSGLMFIVASFIMLLLRAWIIKRNDLEKENLAKKSHKSDTDSGDPEVEPRPPSPRRGTWKIWWRWEKV